MKTLCILFALGLSMSGCTSQNKLNMEAAPFDLGQATFQDWFGGRPETGSGTFLEIPVPTTEKPSITLKNAYFREKIAEIRMESAEEGWLAKASFRTRGSNLRPDIVMHHDPKKEVGNRPPASKTDFPFELGPNECVISYFDGETLKYFKVEGIKEKKPLFYQ